MLPVAARSERVTDRSDPGSWHRRLPRWAYWLAGAVVACSGALLANRLSAELPLPDRAPYWLAGSAVIFIGLWIVAQGSHTHRGDGGDGPG